MAIREAATETMTRLEFARRRAGISQEQLAQEYRVATGTKTSTQTIGMWCRLTSNREPTVSEMKILSDILDRHLEAKGDDYRLDFPDFHVSLVEQPSGAPVVSALPRRDKGRYDAPAAPIAA